MHRSTPSRRSPPSAANARPGAAGGRVVGRGRRRSAVERQRPDDDARVEDVAGVPDRLPLAERGDERRAELAGQELAPGAAVAVLAAERPAVRDREVRGGRQEPLEAILAARPVEAEPRPQVEAALAEVAVDRPLERVLAEQPAELPDVAGEPVRRGRRGPRTRATPACRRGAAPTGPRCPPGRATGRPARAGRRGRARPPIRCRRPIAASSRAAWSRAAAGVSPPASTRSQAPPAGSRTSSSRPASSSWLRLSTVSGLGGEQGRDRRRRLDVVREPEHEQDARRGRRDEPQRHRRDDGARALGPGRAPARPRSRAPAAASRARSRTPGAARAAARRGAGPCGGRRTTAAGHRARGRARRSCARRRRP